MATIHKAKIGRVENLAPGSTKRFQWNNPPHETVLGYFAYADPPPGQGQHGSSQGDVEIVRVTHTLVKDNYNADSPEFVSIYVKNIGTIATAFDLYQSWIT